MAKAARVEVDLHLTSTGFSAGINKGKAQIMELSNTVKRASRSAITDVQATSGALRLIDGGIQNNIRSAERWLSRIKGVGPALQAIYPGVGMIATVALVARGASTLDEFIKKQKEAASEWQAKAQEMANSSRLSNDELARTNVELENEIAKLEGKHQNVLAAELIEARIQADKLAMSAAEAVKKIKGLLDENQPGLWRQIVFGKAGTSDEVNNGNNFEKLISQSMQDYSDALARGDQKAAAKALGSAQQYAKNASAYASGQIAQLEKAPRSAPVGRHLLALSAGAITGDYAAATSTPLDFTQNIEDLRALRTDADAQLTAIAESQQALRDRQRLQNDRDAKDSATTQMNRYRDEANSAKGSISPQAGEDIESVRSRELAAEAAFWASKLEIVKKGTELYKQIQKELDRIYLESHQQVIAATVEQQKLLEDRAKFLSESFGGNLDLARGGSGGANQGKDVLSMLEGLNQSVAIANRNKDAWSEAQIEIGRSTGQLGKYDVALQTLQLHRRQYDREAADIERARAALVRRYGLPNASPEARAAFGQLDNQQAALDGQYKIQSAQDRAAIFSETPLGAWQEALNKFVQDSRDTASQVRDIWADAFGSVNDEIVKIISTRHNYGVRQEFGNIGAGIFRNVASAGLKHAEGSLLGALGFGGKPDGTASKPLYVRIVKDAEKAAGDIFGGIFGRRGSSSSEQGGGGNWFTNIIGSIFGGNKSSNSNAGGGDSDSGDGGFFSGLGFANGGFPPVDQASLVGERGPELFVPKVAGTIVPNHQLGGDIHHHINIDARGADAGTEARLKRWAETDLAPRITAATIHIQHDQRARRPAMRRS